MLCPDVHFKNLFPPLSKQIVPPSFIYNPYRITVKTRKVRKLKSPKVLQMTKSIIHSAFKY